MLDGYKPLATQPEVREHLIGLTGAGTAHPTKRYGAGVVVTRTDTGVYYIRWTENPGSFLGFSCALGANTPGNLAGHTVVRDSYDDGTYSLSFILYNAADAAHDLEATEYLDFVVRFKQTGVTA